MTPRLSGFINADDASLIGVNGDFISLNLYSYCLNNPVMCSDESGYAPEWLEWTLDKGIPLISEAAISAQDAYVKADTKDEDWYVRWGTAILAFLGF